MAKCPIPLKEPARSGGLQSLITYAPAFAPFITAFARLLDQGYALIAPLYAPHR